ncbi:RHS repeat-associated core domain-containing protein, partial [Luteibacter sp. PPL201]
GYNGRNRMTVVQQNGATVGSYLYNASGERVLKSVGSASTRFVYDEGSQLLSELGGTNARDYVAVGGVPMAVADGASLGFITADGLGSPRVVTSGAGAVLWAWPYAANPFGEAQPVSVTGYVLNLRFPGQYQDNEAGLKYNVNRSFDAATGRYLESDPVGLDAGPSLYAYVGGRPLSLIDPLGLAWQYAFGVNLTVITPFTGFSVNLQAGVTIDGWNSRGFDQAQINVSEGDSSHGYFFGGGPSAGASQTDPISTGTSSAPYLEGDAAFFLGAGGSATKNSCGQVLYGLSRGIKASPGVGVGGFSGTSYSATLTGPRLGAFFGH